MQRLRLLPRQALVQDLCQRPKLSAEPQGNRNRSQIAHRWQRRLVLARSGLSLSLAAGALALGSSGGVLLACEVLEAQVPAPEESQRREESQARRVASEAKSRRREEGIWRAASEAKSHR
eukprot:1469942-Rhodomonas_salina.1